MSTRPGSGKENGFRSESGQKQTFFVLAQKVRFRGIADVIQGVAKCPLIAISGHSITKIGLPNPFKRSRQLSPLIN